MVCFPEAGSIRWWQTWLPFDAVKDAVIILQPGEAKIFAADTDLSRREAASLGRGAERGACRLAPRKLEPAEKFSSASTFMEAGEDELSALPPPPPYVPSPPGQQEVAPGVASPKAPSAPPASGGL